LAFDRLFPCEDQEQADADEEVEVCDIGDIGPEFIGAAAWPGDPEGEFEAWEWVDEVAYASEHESVVEISYAACDDEPEAGVCYPVLWFGPFGEEDEGDDHRDECEDDEEPSLSCADAEDGAGVEDECELEELWDCDDGFVVGDEVSEVGFGEDIGAVDVQWAIGDSCKGEGL